MKKQIHTAIVVTLSSATLVWADIDSKRLLESIFPTLSTKKTIAREISRPLQIEKPVIASATPINRPVLLAQAPDVGTQNDASPIAIVNTPEPLPEPVKLTFVEKIEPPPRRNKPVEANVWIREHHQNGGLVIPGCDDAIDREYGEDLPDVILCRSRDEGTLFVARSNETDPYSKGYAWNYR